MKLNPNTTILIAEDEEGHAVLVKKNLQIAGIQNPSIHFFNGEKLMDFFHGKDSVHTFNPEAKYILLLDIRMPVMEGNEVLREIKANPLTRRIPVIIVTTSDDQKEIERCYHLGCNLYIVKPVDYAKFAETIQHVGHILQKIEIP
jgi:CheY-like chemotaxis protein